MVAEVSDRRRVAQRLVLDEAASGNSNNDSGRSRPRAVPPPLPTAKVLPFDNEPYVYNGPVSGKGGNKAVPILVVVGVLGALVVIGTLFAKLGESEVARKKAEGELANLTTSFADQSKQLTGLEEQRKKLAADLVTRDHEEQAAKNKAGALKDAVAAAVAGDGVAVDTADGKVRVTIADKALFGDDDTALSDDGRALLVKLARAVAKTDAALDVVARADAKRPSRARAPKDAQLMPVDAWTQSAAKAAVVVHGLDGKLAAKRLLASGRGGGRGVEIILTPQQPPPAATAE